MKKLLVIVFLIISLPFFCVAQTKWKVDPVHSSVQFEVTHMTISTVTGYFAEFTGDIVSKGESFDGARITAEVQVKSINTDNLMRDKHLKEDDFFNANAFPTMKFVSTAFVKKGDNDYQITGDLTIRNVTKSVTFSGTYLGAVKSGNKTISAFKASFMINRFDFNLKWNDTIDTGSLVVGEDVNIKLNLELVKS